MNPAFAIFGRDAANLPFELHAAAVSDITISDHIFHKSWKEAEQRYTYEICICRNGAMRTYRRYAELPNFSSRYGKAWVIFRDGMCHKFAHRYENISGGLEVGNFAISGDIIVWEDGIRLVWLNEYQWREVQ